MKNSQTWFIVKHITGNRKIIASDQVEDDNSEIIELVKKLDTVISNF